MATKALDKQQCLIRLDDTEVEKLAAIQSVTGLGKTGAIRKLIRDFDISDINPSRNFVANGQISKNIFTQLPIREIGTIRLEKDYPGLLAKVDISFKYSQKVSILGYVYRASTARFKDWDYVMIYEMDGVLCTQNCAEDETWGVIEGNPLKAKTSILRLNQIFVV